MTRLFSLTLAYALLGCAILGLTAAPVRAQTYILTNTTIDGSHPISGDIVVGQDSTGTVNTSPTVNILTGGAVRFVEGYNSSTVLLNGGSANDVSFFNSSTLDVLSGNLTNHIYAYDNSTINMSGGAVALDLVGSAHSNFNISGGSVGQYVDVGGNSVFNFSGGSVSEHSTFEDASVATISGGSFGQSGGINFYMAGSSALTLIGNNLAITDIGPVAGFGEEYALGGQLFDGTDLTGYRLMKETGFTGSVTLTDVPEPSNMALLTGVSLTGTAAFLRRRKRAVKAA